MPRLWTYGDICPRFQSQGGSLTRMFDSTVGNIHLWCDTCWPLGGQYDSPALSIYVLADHVSTSIIGSSIRILRLGPIMSFLIQLAGTWPDPETSYSSNCEMHAVSFCLPLEMSLSSKVSEIANFLAQINQSKGTLLTYVTAIVDFNTDTVRESSC